MDEKNYSFIDSSKKTINIKLEKVKDVLINKNMRVECKLTIEIDEKQEFFAFYDSIAAYQGLYPESNPIQAFLTILREAESVEYDNLQGFMANMDFDSEDPNDVKEATEMYSIFSENLRKLENLNICPMVLIPEIEQIESVLKLSEVLNK